MRKSPYRVRFDKNCGWVFTIKKRTYAGFATDLQAAEARKLAEADPTLSVTDLKKMVPEQRDEALERGKPVKTAINWPKSIEKVDFDAEFADYFNQMPTS